VVAFSFFRFQHHGYNIILPCIVLSSFELLVVMLRTVLLVCSIPLALACPFASRGTKIPPGHPDWRRLVLSTGAAPDNTVPDIAGGLFVIPGGGITVERFANKTTADYLDEMAKASVKNGSGPLCYWSWQSLPPPVGFGDGSEEEWGSRGSYDFARMEKTRNGSVEAIRDLCTYAVARLQAKVDPVDHSGVNVFAGVSEGTEFASYLCKQGLHRDKTEHPERCAPGAPIYNQTWGIRWPMSVTIWKFDGTNLNEVVDVMKKWRNNPNQHLLNIMSPGPAPAPGDDPVPIPQGAGSDGGSIPHEGTGWGEGGAVVGKALPCDAIPDRYKYQKPFPQDSSPFPQSSKTYLDEALEYWSNAVGVPMPEAPRGNCCFEVSSCTTASNTHCPLIPQTKPCQDQDICIGACKGTWCPDNPSVGNFA